VSSRLHLNPIACEAHGLCAELLPEMITLDDWGYPILDERPVPSDLLHHARRAADSCPTLALRVQHAQAPRPAARRASTTPDGRRRQARWRSR